MYYGRSRNLTFGVFFIMKLTYDDKVQIYELRKQGQASKSFKINLG